MGRTVDVHEARDHLSPLLEAVEQGEDVVITRAGRPVARLVRVVPVVSASRRRAPGTWRGQVFIADDFDETPESVITAFRGDTGS
jgi:prevent-host-death family protein